MGVQHKLLEHYQVSGNINLGSGSGALTVSQRTFSDYTGVIGGTGSFTKSGVGVLRLNAASTYSGNTILAGGEIIIGISDALPTTSAISFTGASTRLLMLEQNISQAFSFFSIHIWLKRHKYFWLWNEYLLI